MKRSKPILLLDMISSILGMEWIIDDFQPPQHHIRSMGLLVVLKLLITPHFQSYMAVATTNDSNSNVTLLIFQNSYHHLVLVTLGVFNSLAETAIVEDRVAPGTPLAILREVSPLKSAIDSVIRLGITRIYISKLQK
jgi:hypothetical protein